MNRDKWVFNTSLSGWFIRVLRVILGALFLWAGFSKMSQPENFARTIDAFNLLPQILILPTAIILPWVEFLTGLSLLLGFKTRLSACVCSGLLCLFVITLGINILRGMDNMACGCFGIGTDETLSSALIRNVVLITICVSFVRTR
ncbi:MAG: DoxX family membrane protein [Dehalococcoidia bacterium]|nr:DoxX family membrane protein [Dehalococcoidia bacterium]